MYSESLNPQFHLLSTVVATGNLLLQKYVIALDFMYVLFYTVEKKSFV